MIVSVFSGPVQKERVYPLLPTGEYVVTLYDLTFETGGVYGDSLLWKWYLALPTAPTAYICRDDGNEKIQHEYTSPDVVLGSKSHEWIAALTGRALEDGDEPPDAEDLIGKRMIVYVTHQAPKQGPNVGKLREKFVPGSAKRWAGQPGKSVARNVTPASVQAEEPEEEEEDVTRALMVTKLRKLVTRLTKLDAAVGASAQSAVDQSDLDAAPLPEIQQLLDSVQAAITAALDA